MGEEEEAIARVSPNRLPRRPALPAFFLVSPFPFYYRRPLASSWFGAAPQTTWRSWPTSHSPYSTGRTLPRAGRSRFRGPRSGALAFCFSSSHIRETRFELNLFSSQGATSSRTATAPSSRSPSSSPTGQGSSTPMGNSRQENKSLFKSIAFPR